jgi:hypothetical protein
MFQLPSREVVHHLEARETSVVFVTVGRRNFHEDSEFLKQLLACRGSGCEDQ